MNYLKIKLLKYLILAFMVGVLGCKSNNEVDPNSKHVSIPDVNFEKALIQLKN